MTQKLQAAVMATGTEIGKTFVSSAILRRARRNGLSVCALKPAMSGFSKDQLQASDAGQLIDACGEVLTEDNVTRFCRYSFEEALAPNVAARRAGVEISFPEIIEFCKRGLESAADVSIVEGAGGILSPLTDTHLNADLSAMLKLPVVLVTANYLGSVTHTLTALEACASRDIKVAALAISQPMQSYGDPAELAAELVRWNKTPAALFPYMQNIEEEDHKGADDVLRLLLSLQNKES